MALFPPVAQPPSAFGAPWDGRDAPKCFGAALRPLGLALFLVLAAPVARAQYAANYQTNTFDGAAASTNWIGNYIVSSDTGGSSSLHDDVLQVLNGAGLTNTTTAVIGYNVGGSNSLAVVSGTGSLWKNTTFYLSWVSSGNQLIITNGGRVSTGNAFIAGSSTASRNVALVTGNGSLLTNTGNIYVGDSSGSGNQLIITEGGRVVNAEGVVGHATGATRNLVVVSGSNSLWNNTGNLEVGYTNATGNQLIITNGGRVVNANGYVGYNANANNNLVLVGGSNSLWNNTGALYVGNSATGNQLVVTNGGQVTSAGFYVGLNAGANGNAVMVSGSGSLVSNTTGLDVGYNNAVGNQLIITNGGWVVNSAVSYVGYTAGSSNNVVVVSGNGSLWTNTSGLYVGNSGSGNQLIITDGGRVVNTNGNVGDGVGANNNVVLVSGSNSVWNNTSYIYVGDSGVGNQLIITNGGRVVSGGVAGNVDVGYNAGANNNVVVVSGSNSLWNSTNTLTVGYSGSGNQLFITDGGRVTNTSTGVIGYNIAGSNNLAVVSGSNSFWNNAGAFYVSWQGSGNQLIITNGGQVTVIGGITVIAGTSNASNNLAVVSGNGSLWTNASNLAVGQDGSGNRLIITNGGRVVNASGYVGQNVSANSNVVLVSGANSLWNNTGALTVGNGGAGNQLIISNGGSVFATSLVVTNGINNSVVFSGGTLNVQAATVSNGAAFAVGDGTSSAIFSLLGGLNSFANGLTVNPNATLLISNINIASSLGVVTNLGLFNIASGSYHPGVGSVAAGSGVLRVDSGGVLDLTNGAFTVGNTVTNLGTVRMFNGTVTYNQNVVNLGSYQSDPSTNTFNGAFTVGPTATVTAAANDVYAFGSDFTMQSTNRAFNMSTAVAYFGNTNYGITTGTTNHLFDLTGSGALDKGSNWLDHTQLATNFSIGTLSIALDNRLTLTGSAGTNALYVGVLDLSAWNTNAGSSLTNTLEAALSLSINLYYDKYALNNAYLQGVEFNLWGGGLLIPIPEPSALVLTLAAGALSVFILRRKERRE